MDSSSEIPRCIQKRTEMVLRAIWLLQEVDLGKGNLCSWPKEETPER